MMAAALAAMALTAGAAKQPLRFSQTAELDSIKILLPVLQGARENPPKPLEVFRYTLTRGDQSWAIAELDFEALDASRTHAQVANDRDWPAQYFPSVQRARLEPLATPEPCARAAPA